MVTDESINRGRSSLWSLSDDRHWWSNAVHKCYLLLTNPVQDDDDSFRRQDSYVQAGLVLLARTCSR